MPDLGLEVLFKGKNMLRLLGGLGVALRIGAISVLISLPLGILLGVLMTFKNPILKAILRVYLEIRPDHAADGAALPCLLRHDRAFGWDLPGETASIIVFVLWGTAEMKRPCAWSADRHPEAPVREQRGAGHEPGADLLVHHHPQTVRRLILLSINLITRIDQDHQPCADDRRGGGAEDLPADHRGQPHGQPQRGLWHLSDCLYALLPRVLAHQPACELPRKKMEVTGNGRTDLTVDHLVKAMMVIPTSRKRQLRRQTRRGHRGGRAFRLRQKHVAALSERLGAGAERPGALGGETIAYGGRTCRPCAPASAWCSRARLFPHLTVLDNILLAPTKVQSALRPRYRRRPKPLLDRVGLLQKAKSYPRELSGGQKQRVAIVRALCMHPEIPAL